MANEELYKNITEVNNTFDGEFLPFLQFCMDCMKKLEIRPPASEKA